MEKAATACNRWGATYGVQPMGAATWKKATVTGRNRWGATYGVQPVVAATWKKAAVMGRSLRKPMVDEGCNRGGNADLEMMEVLVALATRPLDAGLLKSRRREYLPLLASHELMQPL